MATNHYFNHYGTNTADQRLTENLIVESIKVYGIDVYYMPRETVNMDSIFGEDRLSEFKDARMIEMYVKNVDGFEGEGTLVSNFGLEVRDQVTFTLSQRRFAELNLETGIRATQPATGDISRIKVYTNNNGTVGTFDLVKNNEDLLKIYQKNKSTYCSLIKENFVTEALNLELQYKHNDFIDFNQRNNIGC